MQNIVILPLIAFAAMGTPPPEFAHWRICYGFEGGIWTADGTGQHRERVVAKGEYPTWSPDHSRIAFLVENEVWVASANGKTLELVFQTPKRDAPTGLAWSKGISPDLTWKNQLPIWGQESLLVATGKKLLEIPVNHGLFGKPRSTFANRSGYQGSMSAPALTPDGKTGAISLNGDVWLARTVTPSGGGTGGWDLWRIAALASYDQATYRADAEIHCVQSLDFSPDGRTLAFELSRVGGSGYNVVGLIRNIPRLQLGDESPLTLRNVSIVSQSADYPRFSPDGKWLLVHEMPIQNGKSSSDGLVAISLDGQTRITLIPGAVSGDW